MIYFVQLETGAIKIGFSEDVPGRLRQLASHYQSAVVLLGTMEGGRSEERELHERFSEHRFGRTEQFKPHPDILSLVGAPTVVDQNPDLVEQAPAIARKDMAVRIDSDALDVARIVAAYLKVPVSEYISRVVREAAKRDHAAEIAKRK